MKNLLFLLSFVLCGYQQTSLTLMSGFFEQAKRYHAHVNRLSTWYSCCAIMKCFLLSTFCFAGRFHDVALSCGFSERSEAISRWCLERKRSAVRGFVGEWISFILWHASTVGAAFEMRQGYERAKMLNQQQQKTFKNVYARICSFSNGHLPLPLQSGCC